MTAPRLHSAAGPPLTLQRLVARRLIDKELREHEWVLGAPGLLARVLWGSQVQPGFMARAASLGLADAAFGLAWMRTGWCVRVAAGLPGRSRLSRWTVAGRFPWGSTSCARFTPPKRPPAGPVSERLAIAGPGARPAWCRLKRTSASQPASPARASPRPGASTPPRRAVRT